MKSSAILWISTVSVLWCITPQNTEAQIGNYAGCEAIQQISREECSALELLYTNTLGHRWFRNTGWLRSNQPCGWYGVVCNSKEWPRNIIKIELINNSVGGNLPPELNLLTELEELTISNFQANIQAWKLGGTLPAEFGNMENLRVLNLGNNEIVGDLPDQLGNLSKLEMLSLKGNQLDDFIPGALGKLSELQVLDLSENLLRGNIPDSLGLLSELESLDLSHNRLVDKIPESLGNLKSLTNLDLSNNDLRGNPPESLIGLTSLVRLDLSENILQGLLSPGIVEFARSRPSCNMASEAQGLCIPEREGYQLGSSRDICGVAVEAGCTSCTDLNPEKERQCNVLEEIYFSTNGPEWVNNQGWLASPSICEWAGLRCEEDKLVSFQLPANNLTGDFPDFIGTMPHLESLDLSNNNLSGIVPFSVAQRASDLLSCNLVGNSPMLCMPADSNYLSLGQSAICGLPLENACSLPAEASILTFEVANQRDGIQFFWETSIGSEAYSYELEQKMGNSFIAVARIDGIESNGRAQSYSLTLGTVDEEVLIFRLIQLNPDGSKSFSPEKTIINSENLLVVDVYPNPVLNNLNILIASKENVVGSLELFNLQGQRVLTIVDTEYAMGNASSVSMDLSGFPAGLYFLNFNSPDFRKTMPVTVIH